MDDKGKMSIDRKFKCIVYAALLPLLVQTVASAATITFTAGFDAISIQNLMIDGTTYDVTFGTAGDTTFINNINGANAAIIAIDGVFYASPIPVLGVDNTADDYPNAQRIIILYDSDDDEARGYTSGGGVWNFGADGPPIGGWVIGGYVAEADFTVVQSGAPEPGTLATMLGGVAILALLERKRRTHHDLSGQSGQNPSGKIRGQNPSA